MFGIIKDIARLKQSASKNTQYDGFDTINEVKDEMKRIAHTKYATVEDMSIDIGKVELMIENLPEGVNFSYKSEMILDNKFRQYCGSYSDMKKYVNFFRSNN